MEAQLAAAGLGGFGIEVVSDRHMVVWGTLPAETCCTIHSSHGGPEMRSRRRWGGLLAVLLLACPGVAVAEDATRLAVGDVVERFELKDQFDALHAVDATVRVVLFSRDMDGGDLLKQAVAALPEGFLDDRRARYISDISGMPRLIAKLFALPKLRKRPYPLLLDRNGDATAWIPDVEGSGTLVFLDALRITHVAHHASVSAIRTDLLRRGD